MSEQIIDQDQMRGNRARKLDPATSHEAASRVGEFSQDHQTRIMAALTFGELGAEQIGTEVGLDAYAVRKRLAELAAMHLAEPTGETRRTSTGRSERIWRLVPAQMELI
jgi:predicted ArsR family transcriptional regulator